MYLRNRKNVFMLQNSSPQMKLQDATLKKRSEIIKTQVRSKIWVHVIIKEITIVIIVILQI